MRLFHRSTLTLSTCLIGVAALAWGHSGAEGVVKQRMDLMVTVGKATKEIGRMLKGELSYDNDRVAFLARAIAKTGGDALTGKFPKNSIMGPSEARPAIWTDWQRFADLSAQLTSRAEALASGAGNARDGGDRAPAALFAAMAETCTACHKDFRAKK